MPGEQPPAEQFHYHTPSLSGPRPTMTSRVVNIHLIWFSTLICTSAATIFITSASASSRERQRKTCLGSVISLFQFDPFCCRATTCLWSFQSIPNDIGENENEQRKKTHPIWTFASLAYPVAGRSNLRWAIRGATCIWQFSHVSQPLDTAQHCVTVRFEPPDRPRGIAGSCYLLPRILRTNAYSSPARASRSDGGVWR